MKNFKIIIFFALFFISQNLHAINIIRDDEIENILKDLIKPVILAADLPPENINLYIVNDNIPNAFVGGGSNIFINSGLILELNDVYAIIAVLAHEIGHIKESHLIRRKETFKDQNALIISSFLLGALSAASGAPGVSAAIIAGGGHIGERTILKYSREFEEAADQAAIKYLEKSYGSSIGLAKSFEHFTKFEKLNGNRINPYTVTHPLSVHRINMVKSHLKNTIQTTNLDSVQRGKFERALIKLKSFIFKPDRILKSYKDQSINSLYAQAIAYYKKNNLNKSTALLKQVIDQEPSNSYLYELLGQLNFEFGMINEAINAYEYADHLNPNSVFIKLGLANSYINKNDKNYIKKAIIILKKAEDFDEKNDMLCKSLALAYGKINDLGRSNLYLAKEMIIIGNYDKAKFFADESIKYLPKNSSDFLRATDLIETSILQKK